MPEDEEIEEYKNSVYLNVEKSDGLKSSKAVVKLVGDKPAEELLKLAKEQLKEMK